MSERRLKKLRVTNNMLINNMVYNLNQNLRTLEKLQYQKATGKKFRVPSDNPIGASKSLKFHTDISKLEQYKRNAEDAMSWMTDTEAALGEIGEVLKRAYELSIDVANGTKKAPEDLQKVKEEIDQLREHLIQIGNTTYAGRQIFSGYKTDKPLLDEDGTYNIELREDEIFEYNVGISEMVKVNTLGGKVFGKIGLDDNGKPIFNGEPDYASNINEKEMPYLIAVFDALSEELNSGTDPEVIQESIERLQNCHEQILTVRAEVGAKMNRLEMTEKKIDIQIENVNELLSLNEDVDMAEISMHIAMAENVYISSLMTGAKIIQPTLVQFLT